jgi:Tfp pilus assembly pilus retraction ATPase PilT
MISLEATLAKLVRDGEISLETARLYALRPEEVMKFLKK